MVMTIYLVGLIMAMEYRLVAGDGFQVSREVTELLEDGWRLHGSTSMAMIPGSSPSFVQALTKGDK